MALWALSPHGSTDLATMEPLACRMGKERTVSPPVFRKGCALCPASRGGPQSRRDRVARGAPAARSGPRRRHASRPPDLYYRDQVYWGKLERQQGVYDFSVIEAGLKNAAAVGGKFGFRVFAYCPGCWMEKRTDHASFPPVTPSLPAGGGRERKLVRPRRRRRSRRRLADLRRSRLEQRGVPAPAGRPWSTELGRRYGDDPRLGYVDVGGYGKFGEWWVDEGRPAHH